MEAAEEKVDLEPPADLSDVELVATSQRQESVNTEGAEKDSSRSHRKTNLPLAPMFLPKNERLAAEKKRAAELEAAKVQETGEKSKKKKAVRSRPEKESSREPSEEREKSLKAQKKGVRSRPDKESLKESSEEREKSFETQKEGVRSRPEKESSREPSEERRKSCGANVPLAPMFAPKSERLRLLAEKREAAEAVKAAEEKPARKRRASRVSCVSDNTSAEEDEPPPPRRRKQVARAKPKGKKKKDMESDSEYSISDGSQQQEEEAAGPTKVVLTEYSTAALKVTGTSKPSGPVFGIFAPRASVAPKSDRSQMVVELKGCLPSPFCGSVNFASDVSVSNSTSLWSQRDRSDNSPETERISTSRAKNLSQAAANLLIGNESVDLNLDAEEGRASLSWEGVRRPDIKEALEMMMVPRDGRPWGAPLEPNNTHQWLAARIPADLKHANEDCKQFHKNWNRYGLLPPSARHKHALAKWLELWVKRADTARDRRRVEAPLLPAKPRKLRKGDATAAENGAAKASRGSAAGEDQEGWHQKKSTKTRATGRRGPRRQMCYGCDGSVLVFEPPSKNRGKRGRYQSDVSEDEEDETTGPTYTPFGCSVVVTGETGCGKTSLVYAAAREAGVAVIELSVDSCPPGRATQVGLSIEEAIQSSSIHTRGSQSSVASTDPSSIQSDDGGPAAIASALQLLLIDDVDAILANDRSYSALFGQLIASSRRPVVFTARSIEDLPRQLKPQPVRRRPIIEFWDDLDSSQFLVQSSPQQLPVSSPPQEAVMAVALQLADALYGRNAKGCLPPSCTCTDFRRAALEVEAARRVEPSSAVCSDEVDAASTLLSRPQLGINDICFITSLRSAMATTTEPDEKKPESTAMEALRVLGGNLTRVSTRQCHSTVIPMLMHLLTERSAAGASTRRSTRENNTELFKMWSERQRIRSGQGADLKRCLVEEAIVALLELRDMYPTTARELTAAAENGGSSDTSDPAEQAAASHSEDFSPPGD
ncbi:hypothetical protein FOL47_001126 [Perkinsus chesapeaki]|uniref:AAA+ ATPase domain-containing protein n=1 Tax=Perkinsus chesapeaki TaxID=330153 RepID=A0A7J6MK87_PERCH|nr:hypothetical protein FOL47_001126 [Perkinsus chesapeaki]